MEAKSSDRNYHIALALGTNMGDRLAMLRATVVALRSVVGIEALSPVYETAAAYVTDQPAFLNAALLGRTTLSPPDLLAAVKRVEHELGRVPTFRNGPRLIDIDILYMDDVVLESATLTLPHPRMAEREFVLRPLAALAPDWQHPVTGATVAAMLAALPSEKPVSLGDVLS